MAGALTVFITTNVYAKHPQYANTARAAVIPPSNASHELIHLAQIGLRQIHRHGYRYIKAGVGLFDITPANQRPLDLFVTPDMDRDERLYRTIDKLNCHFGSGTVQHAACGIARNWAMRRDFRSQRYTTCWEELPVVRAS